MMRPMLALLAVPALAFEPYPLTDPELLALTRIETEALWLALERSGKTRERYARTAAAAREQRLGMLSPAVAEAERAVEQEGVDAGPPLERSYPAQDGRARALATGHAMATLLDDLAPGWRDREEPLDQLLERATRGQRTIPLYDDIQAARDETRSLREWITAEQTSYLIRRGYSLTLKVPLESADADPFSALPLEDRSVLYRGDVRLEGEAGSLTVQGHGAWVAPDEIRVSGLALEELKLSHDGPEVVVTGPGLELRLRGAVYTGQKLGMTLDVVPGAEMEADPAAFALFALATAAGHEVVGKSVIPRTTPDALLRQRIRAGGAACASEIARFKALAAKDHPWLDGMLAQTVGMGPPPLFAPDRDQEGFALPRDRDGRFAELPDLLRSYWACANLQASWEAEEEAFADHGQDLLSRSADPLAEARAVETGRWGRVRIVPLLLDRPGRALATSWEDEVTVFVGPPTGILGNEPVDPAVVVHEALHHLVDPAVVGHGCPPLDAPYEKVKKLPGIALSWPTADAWVAESMVRALVLQSGVLPAGKTAEALTAAWAAEGFPLVPAMLAGLGRQASSVWLEEQCRRP
jgi:hypothetical protein